MQLGLAQFGCNWANPYQLRARLEYCPVQTGASNFRNAEYLSITIRVLEPKLARLGDRRASHEHPTTDVGRLYLHWVGSRRRGDGLSVAGTPADEAFLLIVDHTFLLCSGGAGHACLRVATPLPESKSRRLYLCLGITSFVVTAGTFASICYLLDGI